MKKLVTLLLVLTGFVCSASAATLYVNVDNIEGWWYDDGAVFDMYSWEDENTSNNTNWDDHTTNVISPSFMYGGRWYVYEMPEGHDRAIVRRYANSDIQNQTYDITVTDDTYIYLVDKNEAKLSYDYVSAPSWSGLCVRSSVDGYDGYTNNMVCSDGYNTFTKTYQKSDFGEATKFYFRLKHIEMVRFGEDGTYFNTWTQIGPTTNDTEISLPSSVETTNQFDDGTYNNWMITLPTYDFEKIVITAKYINDGGSYKWQVFADAYVSVTTNANGYRTFVVAAPLTISDATAYYAKDNNNGSATAIAISNPPASTPMLIKGDNNQTYSFKVAANGTALEYTNAFVAGTGATVGSVDDVSGYNYILNGNTFYAANNHTVAAGKAYLHLSAKAPAGARVLVFEDEESTGIGATLNDNGEMTNDKPVYNLAGQRVGQPTKGLYIVNGKKVIIK